MTGAVAPPCDKAARQHKDCEILNEGLQTVDVQFFSLSWATNDMKCPVPIAQVATSPSYQTSVSACLLHCKVANLNQRIGNTREKDRMFRKVHRKVSSHALCETFEMCQKLQLS